MYQTTTSVSTSLNGMSSGLTAGLGTINPAALNSSAVLPPSCVEPGPRGLKRSRSPDQYAEIAGEEDDDDDSKPRKRGRPPKPLRRSSDFSSSAQHVQPAQHIPEPSVRPVIITPSQKSPPAPAKQTPTRPSSVKALPTVRDHTSDQLGPEGDEYIPREFDEAGEKKADDLGYPQGGRQFRCRTFTVPKRGQKLFMLATECARVLNYRDSYLLFNKNRSLYKIIATQPEKDHLITQEILPYSYRSRQIAIVTAKSMFRQFGSRVVVNGRRVRDDYWESKAKKQGFTDEDLAGEKRPGGAKSREAAAAESQMHALPSFAQGDVVYANGPVFDGIHPHQLPTGLAATFGPSSVMTLPTSKDYGNVARPRQELGGAPYHDRSQPSSVRDIMNQAAQTADFNKSLNQSRNYRGKGLESFWARPRDPPAPTVATAAATPQPSAAEPVPPATGPATSQAAYTSPRFSSGGGGGDHLPQIHPPILLPQQSSHHPTPPAMATPAYGAPQNHVQSPIHRQSSLQASMRDSSQYQPQRALQRPSPGVSLGQDPAPSGHVQSPYGYSNPSHQQQMWGGPPPQPQASPAMNRVQNPQFSPSLNNPRGQQIASPVQTHHQSLESPHPPQHIHPSHMLPQQSVTSSHPGQPAYGNTLSGIQAGQHPYPAMAGGRQMYMAGQNQQPYLPDHHPQQAGMQGWPAVSHAQQGSWSSY